MKRPTLSIALAHCIAIALSMLPAQAQDGIRWAPDLTSARRASAEFKVPLLIHFYSDNCLPCRTLEQRVYSQTELIQRLNKYFICVKINGSTAPDAAAEYGVHSFPTDVYLSADGQRLYQAVCPQDMSTYMRMLENVAFMNRDHNLLIAAQSNASPAGANPQAAAQASHGGMNGSSMGMTPQSAVANFPGASSGATPGTTNQIAPSSSPTAPTYPGQNLVNAQNQGLAFQNQIRDNAGANLGASSSPNAMVVSGPVGYGNQPQAIAGAPHGGMRNESPAIAQGNALPNQTYPGQVSRDQVVHPNSNRNGSPLDGLAAVAQSSPAKTNAFAAAQAAASQTVSNPYFQPQASQMAQQTMQETPATNSPQPGVTQSRIPAMTVSTTRNLPSATNDSTMEINSGLANGTSTNTAQSPTWKPKLNAEPAKPSLEGYCPFELTKNAQWVEGKAEFAVQHRGKIYWFSSQQAMQEFLASPDSCSPVISGYDPYILLEEGRFVEGSVQHVLREQVSGALLLFSSAESKQKYWDDFTRYTSALTGLISRARE